VTHTITTLSVSGGLCRARKKAILDVTSTNHLNNIWHMHRRIDDHEAVSRKAWSSGTGRSPPSSRPASAGPQRPRNRKAELCNSLSAWKPFSHKYAYGSLMQQEALEALQQEEADADVSADDDADMEAELALLQQQLDDMKQQQELLSRCAAAHQGLQQCP
jgi:hypothetical protein